MLCDTEQSSAERADNLHNLSEYSGLPAQKVDPTGGNQRSASCVEQWTESLTFPCWEAFQRSLRLRCSS